MTCWILSQPVLFVFRLHQPALVWMIYWGRGQARSKAMENNVSQGPFLGLRSVAGDATGPVRNRGNFMLVRGDFQSQTNASKLRGRRQTENSSTEQMTLFTLAWFHQNIKCIFGPYYQKHRLLDEENIRHLIHSPLDIVFFPPFVLCFVDLEMLVVTSDSWVLACLQIRRFYNRFIWELNLQQFILFCKHHVKPLRLALHLSKK